MVTFDAALPGTSAGQWAASDRLPSLPEIDLPRIEQLVVVAAHPDDETLGAGALMHRVSSDGGTVHLVVATDGEASHPHSTTVTPDELVARRTRETDAALTHLAPGAAVHRLRLPDGGLREHRAELGSALGTLLGGLRGNVLVLATWRGDGHRDHRIVGEACAEACATAGVDMLEYPVWMWHWATPDSTDVPWERLRRVPLRDRDRAAKRGAIDEYSSQIAPLSAAPGDEAVLGAGVLDHVRRGLEVVFTPARGDYFAGLYARHADPWGYDSRWYERRKRTLTTAALRRQHYRRTLELGCATGALTSELADRSDAVVGVDAAHAAIERARDRLADLPHVTLVEADVRDGIPAGRFDLIVLSELGYYLDPSELQELLTVAQRSLTGRGELLVCHWRHHSSTFRQSAEEVHEAAAALGLRRQVHHEEPDLLLDLYSVDANSVASLEGLA